MTSHSKTITVPAQPARQVEVHTRTSCDLCGRQTSRQFKRPEGTNWVEGNYDHHNVCVSLDKGTSYPEGGRGEVVYFDICDGCFERRLAPWLKEQGAEPQTKEWDY